MKEALADPSVDATYGGNLAQTLREAHEKDRGNGIYAIIKTDGSKGSAEVFICPELLGEQGTERITKQIEELMGTYKQANK